MIKTNCFVLRQQVDLKVFYEVFFQAFNEITLSVNIESYNFEASN